MRKSSDTCSNLKPSTVGYKMAWDRLKQEYGQTKVVINAHVDEILNLPAVRGSKYERVQEFYDKLSKNYDALQTLGHGEMLQGLVMTTINKLPQVKPDLVRLDENWEDWKLEDLIRNLRAWLKRNKVEESTQPSQPYGEKRKERHLFTQKGEKKQSQPPHCIYCKGEHWSNQCKVVVIVGDRKKFFVDRNLCFNCGRAGHRGNQCRSRNCFKCGSKHHTSLCEKESAEKPPEAKPIINGYSSYVEEPCLPAIVPVEIDGEFLWAFLDTGSGRNFISHEAAMKLNLNPMYHETREIVTVNGTAKQSMPVYKVKIKSIDGNAQEEIEVTGSKVPDFTTVKRPDITKLKQEFDHAKDKMFYKVASNEYPIHLILGDKTYSKIRTERVLKGNKEDPIVEETTFGWIIHGGEKYTSGHSMYIRESTVCEQLYSLDVLGVEDLGDKDQLQVLTDFKESVTKQEDGRYEVSIPWIPGAELSGTNEQASRRRQEVTSKKLMRDEKLKEDYEKIIKDQLDNGVVDRAPEVPTGKHVNYMPHKPVVREMATTTKVRMVFDASSKPDPLSSSINNCMFTGPSLQPLLWNILIRARLAPNLLLGDLEKAFLQIAIKEEDRDAFRFLFNINGKEEHLRFTRLPFGVEASPFLLGATLGYHYDQQPAEFEGTVTALKENTYVDNIMETGEEEDLLKFKRESTIILNEAKFPIHKWESNIESLEDDNMPNPSKILGYNWDKREDTLEVKVTAAPKEESVTKRAVLSRLGKIYDPLGIISPTMAEGKHIFREVCDHEKGWNTKVSPSLETKWDRWSNQLKNVKVPRSVTTNSIKTIQLHIFADASNLACCAAAVAVVEHATGVGRMLLTSKSRISKRNTSIPRLELVSGHMAANLAKNLHNALQRWPVRSTTIWMDSLVALYWISNPGKPWKTFVSNRVKKIAETTSEIGITWKYCPSRNNLADLGSRGASMKRMESEDWYNGPEWLLNEDKWPEQPQLRISEAVSEESKPIKEEVLFTKENYSDEWDKLLERSSYWRTLRVTSWALRFVNNCLAKIRKGKKKSGPIGNDEITAARSYWVIKKQRHVNRDLQTPGWSIVEDKTTKILKCKGRIQGYSPVYLEGGLFVEKLIQHVHEQIKHLGIANTMASIREVWWIPQLRSKVKKVIKRCAVCKLYSTKPYGATTTSNMPNFRTDEGKPFEVTGVDFAGPLKFKINKKEEEKCYVLVFTCASSRAVHLELTKTQEAEEFQRKLTAFIARRGRPRLMISDHAATFKTTAKWIKIVRKSEKLQDYLAIQEISWKFNLAKSPWWGGIYERLIKDIKKTLYKTLGRTHLSFENLEMVLLDIEINLNNRPLTYVESESMDEQVLTPNTLIQGENLYLVETRDEDEEEDLTKMQKRIKKSRDNAWKRWKREYVHSLMETHRVNNKETEPPEVGDIVLVVGEEKNRGEWKKGRVVRVVKGKDGVVRGVELLHKGHTIERPLQLICPLEIHCVTQKQPKEDETEKPEEVKRPRRQAAKDAEKKIRTMIQE